MSVQLFLVSFPCRLNHLILGGKFIMQFSKIVSHSNHCWQFSRKGDGNQEINNIVFMLLMVTSLIGRWLHIQRNRFEHHIAKMTLLLNRNFNTCSLREEDILLNVRWLPLVQIASKVFNCSVQLKESDLYLFFIKETVSIDEI